ncbi:MAG: 5-formyltetrahydrofolate cyclo-ligase [Clostridia bacterium]|nr:5-formyltetrahydrofolate cyclo-ligase [Clostridia bacterium]
MHSARDEKKELRKHCSLIRDGIEAREKIDADRRILQRLTSLTSYRFASLILLYAPIKSEIDVWPLLESALHGGKQVALPLCEEQPGVMSFRLVTKKEDLTVGAFGVMEPSKNAPIVGKELLRKKDALLVVPALAFDKHGYRLGYGKGYYDRFLSEFGGTSVGLVYRRLLFDRVPKGYYDRKVDLLVSESGVLIPHD